MQTVVSAEDLPAEDRFDFWQAVTSRAIYPVHLRSNHAADFQAKLRLVDLDGLQASLVECPPVEAFRTAKLISSANPDLYQLSLSVRGHATNEHNRKVAVMGPGDMVLCDSSQPFRATLGQGSGPQRVVLVSFPRALLPLPENRVGQLVGTRISGGKGMAGLLSHYLLELTTRTGEYQDSDLSRLGTITMDLLAATVAQESNAQCLLPPETHKQTLLVRVKAFIQQHLGEPDLTPETVAAAHGVSVRSLHRLFQEHRTTVAKWIREQRLERCRRDLADAALRTHKIHWIAARWGFPDATHFSRAFRTAYGMSPNEYRRQHQVPSGSPDAHPAPSRGLAAPHLARGVLLAV